MENGILLQITYLFTVLLLLALSFAESMLTDRDCKSKRTQNNRTEEHTNTK